MIPGCVSGSEVLCRSKHRHPIARQYGSPNWAGEEGSQN